MIYHPARIPLDIVSSSLRQGKQTYFFFLFGERYLRTIVRRHNSAYIVLEKP